MILLRPVQFLIFYIFVIFSSRLPRGSAQDSSFMDVTMPSYSPVQDEQYVCVAFEVTTPGYVVEFLPSATADRTHHMLAYGCNDPIHQKPGETWDCEHAPMCNDAGKKILYAWARNAPPLALPQNVGVPIGKDAGVGFIVLQMHYAQKFQGKVFDNSGVRLRITPQQPPYLGGIYLFVPSGGPIPANTPTFFMNATCDYNLAAEVHPFAFRPHTHHLGRIVSAYKYSKDGKWSKIGKGNPQWPQRFYPIDNAPTITNGDILAGQCLYDSTAKDTETFLGAHGHDEMCNFYMYYYINATQREVMNEFMYCGGNEHADLFKTYPIEASTRFAPNPEMEETAKATDYSFSVLEKSDYPASNVLFGQIAGLAMDSKGNLVVFHRADRTWGNTTFDPNNHFQQRDAGPIPTDTVITLSENGTIISRWGKGFFYLPHGLFIDEHDFVWLTDVAMQQVFKFDMKSSAMKPLLELGERFKPGSDEKHFCKPAAVAVAAGEGSVFVADGYCNNRIVKFTYDGKYVTSWGEASDGKLPNGYPKLGTFSLPHGLSLDDARRRMFVADRENGRVQIFTFDGTPLGQLTDQGFGDSVYSVAFCPAYDEVFVVNGPSWSRMVDQRVFSFDGSTQRLMFSWQPQDGVIEMPHTIVSSKDCSHIFVGQIGPNKLWRFDIISSGRRAGVNPKGAASGSQDHMHSEHSAHIGHKPGLASDEVKGDASDLRSEAESTLKLILILFVAIAAPIVLVIFICCCIRCRKRGGYRGQNLLDGGYGKKNGLFSNGFRDHKGFKPLSTDDIDASDDTDDSDAEHTLYSAQKKFGIRKA